MSYMFHLCGFHLFCTKGDYVFSLLEGSCRGALEVNAGSWHELAGNLKVKHGRAVGLRARKVATERSEAEFSDTKRQKADSSEEGIEPAKRGRWMESLVEGASVVEIEDSQSKD